MIKQVPVTVKTEGFNYDISAQAEIGINYGALSDAIARNPGLYAVWAWLEADARYIYDNLVGRMEVLEAELFEQYRASVGSPVDAIKACVRKDPKRVELTAEIAEAKRNLELLTVGKRTIEQRKDSLLALASNWRAEMQSRVTVSDRQARELADRARGSQGTSTLARRAR